MKIIFINYGPYAGCSGVHIHFLAQNLTEMGHDCVVALPYTTGAQSYFGEVTYTIISHNQLIQQTAIYFKDAILHAWTPREIPRIITHLVHEIASVPYIVHLEDNEIEILAHKINIKTLEEQKIFAINNPQAFNGHELIHPLHFEKFLQNSSGVTCIIKKLEEFVPENTPKMTFWPACEESFFTIPQERQYAIRKDLGINDNTYILVYPGAVHANNVGTFLQLLYAIEALHKKGYSIKLLRTGIEYNYRNKKVLDIYNQHVLYCGTLEANMLPSFISLADILVQPGCPGTFDDYRFPSKIPFFLASARPVILPNTNVAEALKHGQDCFLLKNGSSEEIAHYIETLIEHPLLAKTMGSMGRMTALRLFNWQKSAESVLAFYQNALECSQ